MILPCPFLLTHTPADCLDPSCSGHGTCINAQCYCKAGWQGEDCGTVDQQVYQCLPGCSEHGTYDLETATCVCDRHWTGNDCSQGELVFVNTPLVLKPRKCCLFVSEMWTNYVFI